MSEEKGSFTDRWGRNWMEGAGIGLVSAPVWYPVVEDGRLRPPKTTEEWVMFPVMILLGLGIIWWYRAGPGSANE